jgi:hypothetical protein
LRDTSNKINTTTTGLPDAKITTKTSIEDNPALVPPSFGAYEKANDNMSTDKRIQIDQALQTRKVAASAKGTLNPSDTPQELRHDSSFESVSSKDTSKNTSIAPTKPLNINVDKDWDDIGPYGRSMANISNKSQRPTITINKLEVHVIGNNKAQRAIFNRSIESTEGLHHLHHHNRDNFDLESRQVNTETLNKSYLWKYKVRL